MLYSFCIFRCRCETIQMQPLWKIIYPEMFAGVSLHESPWCVTYLRIQAEKIKGKQDHIHLDPKQPISMEDIFSLFRCMFVKIVATLPRSQRCTTCIWRKSTPTVQPYSSFTTRGILNLIILVLRACCCQWIDLFWEWTAVGLILLASIPIWRNLYKYLRLF